MKNRFRGKYGVSLDDRGRMRIPARYLSIMESTYGREIYLTSLNGDHVLVYPLKEWTQIEQRLETIKMNPVVQEYISRTSYWGNETEIDNRGRILVANDLRARASLGGDMFVLGVRDHLEIWSEEIYRQQYLQGNWTIEKQEEIARVLNGIPSLSSDE